MNPVWVIAKKELGSFFDSLVGYMIVAVFLILTGIFTWLYGSDIFFRRQADLAAFFASAQWLILFLIPAITMKQIAEEKKSGTIELLLTKNISTNQLVIGKFIACLLMVVITLFFTLPYFITITQLGDADSLAIIVGYLGLLLLSAAYISIGIYTSSLTDNQIVAFLLALFICLLFQIVFPFLSNIPISSAGEVFYFLGFPTHYESLSKGIIDTKDIIFFGSIIFFFLFLAEKYVKRAKTKTADFLIFFISTLV